MHQVVFFHWSLSCSVFGFVHSCGCVVLYRPRLSLVGSWSDADGRFVQCEFSFSRLDSFELRAFMRQIATLLVTTSFLMLKSVLIRRSLLCSTAILMLSSTAIWTELAWILSILSVRALFRFHAFSRPVALLVSGATCIRLRIVSHG